MSQHHRGSDLFSKEGSKGRPEDKIVLWTFSCFLLLSEVLVPQASGQAEYYFWSQDLGWSSSTEWYYDLNKINLISYYLLISLIRLQCQLGCCSPSMPDPQLCGSGPGHWELLFPGRFCQEGACQCGREPGFLLRWINCCPSNGTFSPGSSLSWFQ